MRAETLLFVMHNNDLIYSAKKINEYRNKLFFFKKNSRLSNLFSNLLHFNSIVNLWNFSRKKFVNDERQFSMKFEFYWVLHEEIKHSISMNGAHISQS